ncbi:hypothetical protein [Methylobacterium sp. E-066]|nr:hypothetical protein [Methylobacterium sp. E-066]
MTQAYANQILGIALGLSASMFVGAWIATRLYDRKTRRLDAQRSK